MNDIDRLHAITGSSLTGARRIFHVLGNDVDRSSGAVELSFSSGQTIWCDAGPDGDSLSVNYTPWVDPFEGHMTEENIEYVSKYGKLTAIDTSDEAPFDHLIGKRIMDVAQTVSVKGNRIGLVFNIYGTFLTVYSNSDETRVSIYK